MKNNYMEVIAMKKRRVFVINIAMLMMVTLFLSACASTQETDRESKDIIEEEQKNFGTFILLSKEEIKDSDITQYILYDPETKIMWTFMDGYRCGGPAILYNADGTFRLYEP